MSKTILFKGGSDDTFMCLDADEKCIIDHDDCAKLSVRTFEVASESTGARVAVTGVYGLGCMWSVGIGPTEDDEPLPDWLMHWSFRDYTAVLTMTVPDDVTVALVHPERKDR